MTEISMYGLREFMRAVAGGEFPHVPDVTPDRSVVSHRIASGEPLFLVAGVFRWVRGDEIVAGLWEAYAHQRWVGGSIDESDRWSSSGCGIRFADFMDPAKYRLLSGVAPNKANDAMFEVIQNCRVIVARVSPPRSP